MRKYRELNADTKQRYSVLLWNIQILCTARKCS